MTERPELKAVEAWLLELIRTTGLRADPFSLYGYTTHNNNPYGIVMELSDGSSYKLALSQLMKPPKLCSICGGPHKARGLCSYHYDHLLKVDTRQRKKAHDGHVGTCREEGCEKRTVARGYCKAHYEARRKRGEFSDD